MPGLQFHSASDARLAMEASGVSSAVFGLLFLREIEQREALHLLPLYAGQFAETAPAAHEGPIGYFLRRGSAEISG